ncbi:MAG: hypothetical protein AAGE89_10275 [Pseudomonadota bacterium]
MRQFLNTFYIAIGLVLLSIGTAVMVTPIPGGIVMISIGLFLLVKESRFAKAIVFVLRRDNRPVNKALSYIEARAPRFFSRIIRRTRPLKAFARRRRIATA